ncbi:NlpC/P60 family protein [Photobacterium nomapromontoriensis]|uniref:NlpC/P60 family protein n=1 Tax=Photobacterium nomapromontoriensis TaxID=2910237 RepID=UPI003D0B7728
MKQSLFLVAIMVLAGCTSDPDSLAKSAIEFNDTKDGSKQTNLPMSASQADSQTFDNVYRQWRGTPYQLGGVSRAGIDCSAFVQVGYAEVMNLSLPRTTNQQVKMGKWVDYAQLAKGDLVFFKTGRALRHVGIYVGDARFLHASTSQGVIISSLKNPYWRSVYWQARRIID